MSTSQTVPGTEFAPSAGDDTTPSATPESTELLALLSDEYVRDVLDCLGETPRSAADLADRIDASRATVYRRLDRLTDAGLVRSNVALDGDGHHCREFRVAAGTATIRFGGDGVTAAVEA